MIGAVVARELLVGERRGWLAGVRRAYAGWLVVQLAFLFLGHLAEGSVPGGAARADVGAFVNSYLQVFVAQHFLVLGLATPVFVAGAVAEEKARRTLESLLAAPAGSAALLAGKLAGRLAQLGVLALAGLPLLCFTAGYGHLDARVLLALVLLTGAAAFGLAGVSTLAGVWSTQTRDAVLRVFAWVAAAALLGAAVLAWAIEPALQSTPPGTPRGRALLLAAEALRCLYPVHVLEPVWIREAAGDFTLRLGLAVLAYSTVGAACLAVAVWRLRPAYFRQLSRPSRSGGWPPPSERMPVGPDPVRWRLETTGERRRWIGYALVAAATIGSSGWILWTGVPELFLWQSGAAFFVATLVVGVRASATVSAERERRTWELLLLTRLETRELIEGRLSALRQAMYVGLVVYAIPAVSLGTAAGCWPGVAVAAVLPVTAAGVYLMASVGVWWSASSASSWRSLLGTLTTGYGLTFGVVCWVTLLAAGPAALLVPTAVWMAHTPGGDMLAGLLAIAAPALYIVGLALALRALARSNVAAAVQWVDEHERVIRAMRRPVPNLQPPPARV